MTAQSLWVQYTFEYYFDILVIMELYGNSVREKMVLLTIISHYETTAEQVCLL